MCKELKLIVEVDGITHSYENISKNDILRQKELEAVGFTVIRFTDEEILTNINSVQRILLEWINRNQGSHHPLNPPPAGDNKKY